MSAVPKLRFPEFDGEWKQVAVEDILQVTRGKVLAMPLVDSIKSSEKPFPVYSSQTKMDGLAGFFGEYLFDTAITWTTDGANAGEVRLRKGKFYCTNVCGVLLSNDGYVNNFIASAINKVAKKHVSYVGNPKLMNGVMARIPIVIPSLPEQQKIASFLSSVDKKIDLLRQKKDALELYKKGLMQKIFSQKIRFKQDDGSDFPDWEDVALGDVVKIRTGKKDVNQGNPQGSYPFFTCAEHNTYSDTYSFDCDAILIAGNGEVGHSQRFSGKFEAYQRTYVLSDFKLKFDYTFVVVNNLFKEFVNKQVQTGAMPYIRLSTLKDFLIPCPSPEEQLKIASLFSKIDQKIQDTSSQIEQMETFKKGLLQQMFV